MSSLGHSDSEEVGARVGFMTKPLAWVLVGIGVVWRLIHHLDLHFTNADAWGRVVRYIEVTSERTELFELHLVDHCALFVGHRELQLTILSATEIFYFPLNPSLRNVKIGTIWILCRLLRLHSLLCGLNIAMGINDGWLDASHILPFIHEGSTCTGLILLMDIDTQDLLRGLESHRHLLYTQVWR